MKGWHTARFTDNEWPCHQLSDPTHLSAKHRVTQPLIYGPASKNDFVMEDETLFQTNVFPAHFVELTQRKSLFDTRGQGETAFNTCLLFGSLQCHLIKVGEYFSKPYAASKGKPHSTANLIYLFCQTTIRLALYVNYKAFSKGDRE